LRIIFWGDTYTGILNKSFLQEPVLNKNNSRTQFKICLQS